MCNLMFALRRHYMCIYDRIYVCFCSMADMARSVYFARREICYYADLRLFCTLFPTGFFNAAEDLMAMC
jgi:hypothetical protein